MSRLRRLDPVGREVLRFGEAHDFALADVLDLPGAADLRATGLLSLNLPDGFVLGPASAEPEDLIEEIDAPEFYQDALQAERP